MIENWEDDAEIYDIFLHSRDRAYTVPQIYEFAKSADLEVMNFSPLSSRNKRDEYSPEKYIRDKNLLARIKKLPQYQQQAIAEVLNSRMNKHNFNLVKKPRKPVELSLDMIPNFSLQLPPEIAHIFADYIDKCQDIVSINMIGLNIAFMKSPNLQAIVAAIDGKTALRQIFKKIIADKKEATLPSLMGEFRPLYEQLDNCQWLFLRAPGVPVYESPLVIQAERFGGKG